MRFDLYRGTPSLSALEWMNTNPDQLGPLERDFLRAGEAKQAYLDAQAAEKLRRTRRWRRAAVGALAALTVGASLSSLIAYRAANEAREYAERADAASARARERFATALGSAAFGHVNEDPRLALALAAESIARSAGNAPSYDTRAAVIAARQTLSQGKVFLLGSPISAGEAITIAMDPGGTLLGIGQAGGNIDLFDIQNRRRWPRSLTGHKGGVRALEFDDSGHQLVSAGADATIRLWPVLDAKVAQSRLLGEAGDIIPDPCFHPNGSIVATASADGTVRLWDTAGLGAIREPVSQLSLEFNSVEFSPDGSALLAASNDAHIHAWSLPSRQLVFPAIDSADTSHLLRLHFNPTGDRVATVSTSGRSTLIRYPQGDVLGHPFTAGTKVGAVASSADGKLLIGGDDQGRLRMWDMDKQREVGVTPSGHSQPIMDASMSHDGRLLATLGRDRSIRLWTLGTEYPLARSYETGGHVRTYDLTDGALIRTIAADDDIVWSLAFSRDGDYLASASGDEVVALWALRSGERKRMFSGHTGGATDVVFLGDDLTLVVTDRSGGLHWWDLQTQRKLTPPFRHMWGPAGGWPSTRTDTPSQLQVMTVMQRYGT